MEKDHEPLFISGTAIIKQFLILLMDFRKTINQDAMVFTDSIWFNTMVCVMNRIREECYLSDEASSKGVLYHVENITKDDGVASYPVGCVTIDPHVKPEDIIDSEIIVDINNPYTFSEFKENLKLDAVDKLNEEFVDLAYVYVTMNFGSSGKSSHTVYANVMLMHTLMHIFNEEVLDTYYTLIGIATPLIDCTSTLLMRNLSLNMMLGVLADCWSVKLPSNMYDHFTGLEDYDESDDVQALIKLKVACKYDPEEFTMDGMDIFSCRIIPSYIAIGAVEPE